MCYAQQSVRFPQDNLGHFVLEFVISPKYSGTQMIARDSHSNRLTSEDTENNLSVYKVSTSNFKPSPLHPWICIYIYIYINLHKYIHIHIYSYVT